METEKLTTTGQYRRLIDLLKTLSNEQRVAATRHLGRTDLYFLLRYLLNRPDMERQWILDRCKEVQKSPNGYLDLWAREHYKSTIITFGQSIQDILSSHGDSPLPKWKGREVTIGIFSNTRPLAKGFLRQIKIELETNDMLKELYPDILWGNPESQAPKWSEDDGLIVRRRTNPKEATVEAWGLVEAMPTGKHFFLRVYDDIVTEKSVTTPEMLAKSIDSYRMSINLGTEGGIERIIGTRYHFNDAYGEMIRDKLVDVRSYPATDDGTEYGEPVLIAKESLAKKRRGMGPYIFATQMLLNPKGDEFHSFKPEWIEFNTGEIHDKGLNKYMIVDPANSKGKRSDYTAIWVIGLGPDENYYALDMVRDRLNLIERTDILFKLHKKWRPRRVGYEEYGAQADIDHIKEKQKKDNYRFEIVPMSGTKLSKEDRIKRLMPLFEQKRIILPDCLFYTELQTKRPMNLVRTFIEEEYKAFPVAPHDDMLDALSRILDEDLSASWPKTVEKDKYKEAGRRLPKHRGSWMGIT